MNWTLLLLPAVALIFGGLLLWARKGPKGGA